MKKSLLFIIMCFCSCQIIWAQSNPDSAKKAKADSARLELQRKMDSARKADSTHKADSIRRAEAMAKTAALNNLAKKDSIPDKACNCCKPHEKTAPNFGEWLLIAVPVVIFLIIFYSIGKAEGFKFNDALTESDQTQQTKQNPQYTIENLKELKDTPNLSIVLPPTIQVTPGEATYRPSISRYIAFITSLFALIIALSMSSFFIYHYISTGCPPDLGALSTILIALGVGMVPYAFNKVSTAIKS
ncbi:MAG: hypothetical protein JWP81_4436 [Ferruginibacter sp.]|nr:hypothetical protein [Ferruginibacter sp.]